MIKRFIIALVLLVIVCGGIVGWNIFRDKMVAQFFATMQPPAATVSTVVAKPMSWSPGIEAIGTVSAVRGVDLNVETAGVVKDILFHANQKVKAGDVLVQLDDAIQQADLAAAKAQAILDKTSLDRALELQKRRVGSDVNVDSARAAAEASQSRVASLQAALDQKQLKAPFDGTVGISRIDLGQYLAPGTTVVTLQDLETMRVDFTVPEQQFADLKIDQPVRLGTGSAEDQLPFTGSIRGIDPKIDPTSRLVAVRAEVANPGGKLTPGQFVQVRVELPKEDNVIALPQTALTTSLYGDYVFLVLPKAEGGASAPAAKPEEAPAGGDAAVQAGEKPAADLPRRIATDELGERLPLLMHRGGGLGVVDRRLDLAAVADDAGVLQEPVDVALAEARDRLDVEVREGGPEVLALAQDREPGQPGLKALEHHALVQATVVGDRPPPFLVVVADVVRVCGSPPAAAEPVVAAGEGGTSLTGPYLPCRYAARVGPIQRPLRAAGRRLRAFAPGGPQAPDPDASRTRADGWLRLFDKELAPIEAACRDGGGERYALFRDLDPDLWALLLTQEYDSYPNIRALLPDVPEPALQELWNGLSGVALARQSRAFYVRLCEGFKGHSDTPLGEARVLDFGWAGAG